MANRSPRRNRRDHQNDLAVARQRKYAKVAMLIRQAGIEPQWRLIFFLCVLLLCGDIERNPGPVTPVSVCVVKYQWILSTQSAAIPFI